MDKAKPRPVAPGRGGLKTSTKSACDFIISDRARKIKEESMNKLTDRPPLSQTDRLCLVALAGVVLTASLFDLAMDTTAYRAAEADKPPVEAVTIAQPIDYAPLAEAIVVRKAELEEELFW